MWVYLLLSTLLIYLYWFYFIKVRRISTDAPGKLISNVKRTIASIEKYFKLKKKMFLLPESEVKQNLLKHTSFSELLP